MSVELLTTKLKRDIKNGDRKSLFESIALYESIDMVDDAVAAGKTAIEEMVKMKGGGFDDDQVRSIIDHIDNRIFTRGVEGDFFVAQVKHAIKKNMYELALFLMRYSYDTSTADVLLFAAQQQSSTPEVLVGMLYKNGARLFSKGQDKLPKRQRDMLIKIVAATPTMWDVFLKYEPKILDDPVIFGLYDTSIKSDWKAVRDMAGYLTSLGASKDSPAIQNLQSATRYSRRFFKKFENSPANIPRYAALYDLQTKKKKQQQTNDDDKSATATVQTSSSSSSSNLTSNTKKKDGSKKMKQSQQQQKQQQERRDYIDDALQSNQALLALDEALVEAAQFILRQREFVENQQQRELEQVKAQNAKFRNDLRLQKQLELQQFDEESKKQFADELDRVHNDSNFDELDMRASDINKDIVINGAEEFDQMLYIGDSEEDEEVRRLERWRYIHAKRSRNKELEAIYNELGKISERQERAGEEIKEQRDQLRRQLVEEQQVELEEFDLKCRKQEEELEQNILRIMTDIDAQSGWHQLEQRKAQLVEEIRQQAGEAFDNILYI